MYEEGNYTKAAAMLQISQPAGSRRISLLESDLDCVLFERGRGGARPTPAGEAFAPFARRVIGELRAGIRAVQDIRFGEHGSLTLAIAGTIPNTRLMQRLRDFRQKYPTAQLTISTGTSDEVSGMVAIGDADVGLRYFAGNNPALESQAIAQEPGAIVAANPTSLLDVETYTPEHLSACPWIMFPVGEGSSGEPLAVRGMEALVAAGIRPNNIVRIDGLSAQKRLVASDFGLALMQLSAVEDEVAAGTIQRIDTQVVNVVFPIHLVLRKHRHESRLRDLLIQELTYVHKNS